MPIAFYLTHPQVVIDPAVPVGEWGLSRLGKSRARAAARSTWVSGVTRIVASAERKAIETAVIVGAVLGIDTEIDARFNENDRSVTGFLPLDEFEAVADAFFADPDKSVRGWERAIDAQHRIVSAVDLVLGDGKRTGNVLFVGHGAVGTLLLCSCGGMRIARQHDQPAGGGSLFAFDIVSRSLVFGWRPGDS
jgi:broad specificity phosphatase PhoE